MEVVDEGKVPRVCGIDFLRTRLVPAEQYVMAKTGDVDYGVAAR